MQSIVRLMAKGLVARLAEKQLSLTIDDSAVEHIVEKGYDPVFGARPLKRYMQHTLETMLSKKILSGGVSAGDTLSVTVKNGALSVEKI